MDGGYTPPRLVGHHHEFVEVENYGLPTGFWICVHDPCRYGHEPWKTWALTEEARDLEGKLYIDFLRT